VCSWGGDRESHFVGTDTSDGGEDVPVPWQDAEKVTEREDVLEGMTYRFQQNGILGSPQLHVHPRN